METLPMPLDTLVHHREELDDYRIDAPAQIRTMLHALLDGSVPLAINGPEGATVGATLWTIDAARGVISFSATPGEPHLQQIVQGDEAIVVGYLDSVKLQFDAHELMLVHAGRQSALSCAYPTQLFRFQRRGSFRVRPVLRSAPVARLRHPEDGRIDLALRILDVSLGGCALLLPDDVPRIHPGTTLRDVVLDFDADTRFSATLQLHHLSTLSADAIGLRMGCELLQFAAGAERMLQLYIDQTQKRRRLMVMG